MSNIKKFLDQTGVNDLWKIISFELEKKINNKGWSANKILATDENGNVIEKNLSSELPIVEEADNGKFLRVVDGAWVAQNIPIAEEAKF